MNALWRGLLRGLLAFAAVVALALAVSFVDLAAAHHAGSIGSAFSLGAAYLAFFHGAPVSLSASTTVLGASLSAVVSLRATLLLGTGVGIFLLFRAGVSGARDFRGEARVMGLVAGVVPALPYSIGCLLFTVAFGSTRSSAGSASLTVGAWGSLLSAVMVSLISCSAGLVFTLLGHRARAAVAGTWQMFTWALILAFAGLVLVATVKPSASRGVFPGVTRLAEPAGPALLANNLLALPNEAAWALAPATGGCDGAYGNFGSRDLLCYGHFPQEGFASGLGLPRFGTAHPVYFLFLLVPLVATIWGGWHSAEGSSTRLRGAANGASAGALFGILVGAIERLSSLSFSGTVVSGASPTRAYVGTLGPKLPAAALLALAWGLVGGAVGGASRRVGRPARAGEPVSDPGSARWSRPDRRS